MTDRKTPTYAELAEDDTRPGSPRGKRRSSASQLKAVVCSRCHDYRMQIARLQTQLDQAHDLRIASEQRAKHLADELRRALS